MIELEGINRIFQVGDQKVHALDNINLTIEPGDYLSIMGPSGSGKSTLLNIVGLLDQPTSGIYRLDNQDTTTLTDNDLAHTRRLKIGFIFQFFQLLGRLTAQENVELPMMLEGVSAQERKERANAALDSMGLADRVRPLLREILGQRGLLRR